MTLALLGGNDAGVGHLLDYIAHAAIWSAVSHFVRGLPGGWLLIVVLVAGVVIVRRFRRFRRPATTPRRGSSPRGGSAADSRQVRELRRRVADLEDDRDNGNGLPPHPAEGMGGRPWHRRAR